MPKLAINLVSGGDPRLETTMIMPAGTFTNINSQLIEEKEATKVELNRAFKYGDGAFETILIRNGVPWFLDDHLQRLSDGLDILGFDYQAEVFLPILKRELFRTLEANRITQFGRTRIQIYRGGGGAYMPEHNRPHFVIETFPYQKDPWLGLPPLSIGIYHHIPIAPSPLTRFKSSNSLPYVLGAKFAQDNGWSDVLMRSTDGYIIESTKANLFVVHAATVFTPPIFGGCIPGIMRKNIIRILKENNIQLEEKHLTHLDLGAADEIFLSNSIRGIMSVEKITGTTFEPAEDALAGYIMDKIRKFPPPKLFRAHEN